MTDATTSAREVEVTQSDIEAANHAVRLAKKRLARMGGRGSLDPVFFYKAFARHRIAAEQTAALADAPGERGGALGPKEARERQPALFAQADRIVSIYRFDTEPDRQRAHEVARIGLQHIPTEPTAATRTSGSVGREAIARCIRIAMQSEFLSGNRWADRVQERTRLANQAADAILALQPDHFAGAGNMIDREAVEAEAYERAAKVAEQFPLAEDHPDAGVLGCRDLEIADAIRALRNLGPR